MYRYISQHCIYPAYEMFTGRQFLQKWGAMEQSQWWDSETLKKYQLGKLKTLVNFAFEKNPYYRRQFKLLGLDPARIDGVEDFSKVPILTKDDIARNLPEFISAGYGQSDLRKFVTGGSTGRNLTFYMDRNTFDSATARVLRGMNWFNCGFGDKRVKIWGSPIRESLRERSCTQLRNFLLREKCISSYAMNEKTILEILRQIQRAKPKALIGYVSALTVLASFIEKHAIEEVRVDAILPAAETIFQEQISLFERSFHGKVFNRYGSREFNGIAQECSFHTGMHVNAETVYVEVIKNGRPARPGELGEIIITDLDNFGMPFIRYRIEDLGILSSKPCECGRGLPLLDRVEGRIYDLISCPNGSIQTGTFFSNLTRSVEGISQFQVIQESKGKIRLKLVTQNGFRQDSKDTLTSIIREHCGETMQIDFDFVTVIEPLKSGKHRYVVSLTHDEPLIADQA